ncbi:MAG: acyltransferase family protein [Eubacterium limosum]|nr:acyltransferase family protein [Eubacterium limosum]
MHKRVEWIDITKGILIALIVLGHVISDNANHLQTWIYSFHVCGFFIINGLLKAKYKFEDNNYSLKDVVIKQKSIYILYLVFSLIFFARVLLQARLGMYNANEIKTFVLHIISFNGEGVLWFLPVFSITEIVLYIVVKYRRIVLPIYITALAVAIYFAVSIEWNNILQIDSYPILFGMLLIRCSIASSFSIIGYYFEKSNLFNSKIIYIGIGSVLAFINGNVDLNNLRFGNIVLYYIFSILGTFFIIGISKFIEKKALYMKKILTLWGRNSLIIMLTHAILLIYQTYNIIFLKFVNNEFLRILFVFFMTMITETYLIIVFNKIIFYLEGKYVKNQRTIYKK